MKSGLLPLCCLGLRTSRGVVIWAPLCVDHIARRVPDSKLSATTGSRCSRAGSPAQAQGAGKRKERGDLCGTWRGGREGARGGSLPCDRRPRDLGRDRGLWPLRPIC
jgi:hypothetical protein